MMKSMIPTPKCIITKFSKDKERILKAIREVTCHKGSSIRLSDFLSETLEARVHGPIYSKC